MNNDAEISSILTFDEVIKMTTLSRTTIYRLLKNGEIPPRIKIGKARVGWRKSAIESWLDSRELVS